LIESARFDPMSVRRTARALGLFSPSSYRFERPMDPERTEWASRRCAELILETAGGTLHPGVIDIGPVAAERPAVTLRLDQIPRVLGIEIAPETVDRILRALGLSPLPAPAGSLSFRPPSWRADLEREIDLIEDVARIHGYEHIPEDRPVPLAQSAKGPRERVEAEIRSALTGMGFDEAVTFSLVADDLAAPIESGPALPPIRVEHSSRRRENTLRQSLAPSLLAARAHNEAHGTPDADLFEIAHVYLPQPGKALPSEPPRLALVSGDSFLALKGVIEALLDRLHAGALGARGSESAWFAPGRAAELRLGGKPLGMLGEIDRVRLDQIGLRGACSVAELSLEVLIEQATLVPRHHPLPPFPAVARDLSLVVARSLPWADLADAAKAAAGPTLEALRFLDTFDLPNDQHSVHFGLRFRGTDRTLTGDEVEAAIQTVIDVCASRFGATLRT
jgi:phenylalanyl-tRNA synthetase beta chain